MKANLDKNLAPAWVSGKSYSTGEFCLYNKRLYICTTDNSDAEFDNSKWEIRNLVDLVSGINSNLFNKITYGTITANSDGSITIPCEFQPKIMQLIVQSSNAIYMINYNEYISNQLVYGYARTDNTSGSGGRRDFTNFYSNKKVEIPSLTTSFVNKTVYYTFIKEVD